MHPNKILGLGLFLAAALQQVHFTSATDYTGWVVHPEFDDKEEFENDELFQEPNVEVEWDDNFHNFNEEPDNDFIEEDFDEDLAAIEENSPRKLRSNNRKLIAPVDIETQVVQSVNDLRRSVGLDDPPVRLQSSQPLTIDCKPNEPTASNMRELTWDDELAERASVWAENCRNSRNRDEEVKEYGEIRYIKYTSDPADHDFIQSALDHWSSQSTRYNYRRSKCQGGACHSYVQLVRDKATRIGCAVSKCPRITGSGGRRKEGNMMVCYLDSKLSLRRPYRAGRQCALCPASCVDGLCKEKAQIYRACQDYTGPYPICRITWNGVRHSTCASLWEQAGTGACTSPWVRNYYCRVSCGTCDPSEPDVAATNICGTALPPPDPCSHKRSFKACSAVKKGKWIRLCTWKRKTRKCTLRESIPYLTGI